MPDDLAQLPKLCGRLLSDFDHEVLTAARMIRAKFIANDWSWEQLLANGSATSLTEEQMQKIYAAGLQKGEQLGYQRGLADAQAGSVRTARSEIGGDIDWAKTVFAAANTGKACLRDQDVDFANDMLAKFQKWGASAYFSQAQHNYVRIIETKLKRHGYL